MFLFTDKRWGRSQLFVKGNILGVVANYLVEQFVKGDILGVVANSLPGFGDSDDPVWFCRFVRGKIAYAFER